MPDDSEDTALAVRAEAAQHFRVDLRAVSYREIWELSRVQFPLNALLKLLRVPPPALILVPLSTSLGRTSWDAMTNRAREQLQALVEALRSHRFSPVLIYTEDWRARRLDAFNVALLDDARTTIAIAAYTCLIGEEGGRWAEHVDLAFYSKLHDGRLLLTSSSRYQMRGPPQYEALRLPERPPVEVAGIHAERMAELQTRSQPYRDAESFVAVQPEEVESIILTLSRREAEFQTERGVYLPATTADLAGFEKPPPPVKPGRTLRRTLVWLLVIVLGLVIANLLLACGAPGGRLR